MKYFENSMGELGTKRVQDQLLSALPTESEPLEAADSLARLQHMEQSALLDFAGLGAKSMFQAVMAHVRSICEQTMPNFQGATDTVFFKQV